MKAIFNERVLIDEKKEIGVVADIHLGVERELGERGIIVKNQTENIARRLCEISREHNLKKLIIMGDVKHKIYTITEDVVKFFNIIQKCFDEVLLIPGNHDAPIEEMKNFCNVADSRGLLLKNEFFWHGHTWPSEEFSKSVVAYCAHAHPEIEIPSVGSVKREACWLVCRLDESLTKIYKNIPSKIVIVPSFNPLVGYSVKRLSDIDSPIFRYLKNCRAILLNGTEINL